MEANEKEIPEIFLVLRFGKNVFTKNGETSQFDVAEADVDAIIREFEERKRDLVIDYEHQSLNGQKAPAAGWIDRLEKTAEGLQAHVRYWTEDAQKYLKSGEYRYFSPTLYFSEGKPVALHSVALTNHPALHLGRIKRTCGIAHGVIFLQRRHLLLWMPRFQFHARSVPVSCVLPTCASPR